MTPETRSPLPKSLMMRPYEVAVPENVDEARVLMRSAMSRVESALAVNAYDEIHEAGYELEAAASRISEDGDKKSEVLFHTIEILHLASEIGDHAILQATFPRLKEAVDWALSKPGS